MSGEGTAIAAQPSLVGGNMNRALATGQEHPEPDLNESTWPQLVSAYRVAEAAFGRIAHENVDEHAEAVKAIEEMREIVSQRG